jgi:hypothetical protein
MKTKRQVARIVIDLSNDAFRPSATAEISRILLDLSWRLQGPDIPDSPIGLRDANGNKVGEFSVRYEPL